MSRRESGGPGKAIDVQINDIIKSLRHVFGFAKRKQAAVELVFKPAAVLFLENPLFGW